MEIWPAIDLRCGKAVRLQQGDYDRLTVFSDQPADVARRWVNAGAKRLHLVDLDAARGDDPTTNRRAVAEILKAVNVPCQLGGGVRNEATIQHLLDLGLARLILGSAALKQPAWFAKICDLNPQRLVAGIDARNGFVATEGWLETSQTEATELAQHLRSLTNQIAAIVYTDIAKDGMMCGPNFDGLIAMKGATDIPIVASGGVSTLDDLRRLVEFDIPACIIGRALYDDAIKLEAAIALSND